MHIVYFLFNNYIFYLRIFDTASNTAVEPVVDLAVVESLTEMGFPLVACKRAAILTQGAGLEAATQWIMEHMDDPDFLTPPLNSLSGRICVEKKKKKNPDVIMGYRCTFCRNLQSR